MKKIFIWKTSTVGFAQDQCLALLSWVKLFLCALYLKFEWRAFSWGTGSKAMNDSCENTCWEEATMASARVLLGWQMSSPDMFIFTNVCAMIMLSIMKEYPKAIEETKIFMKQILRQIISQYLYSFFLSRATRPISHYVGRSVGRSVGCEVWS